MTMTDEEVKETPEEAPVSATSDAAVSTDGGEPESIPAQPEASRQTKVTILAGNKPYYRHAPKGNLLRVFAIIFIVLGVMLPITAYALTFLDSLNANELKTIAFTEMFHGRMVEFKCIVYGPTEEHYAISQLLGLVSIILFTASMVVLAIRKAVVFPFAAKKFRKLNQPDIRFIDGYSKQEMEKTEQACPGIRKRYTAIRIMTFVLAALLLGVAVLYLTSSLTTWFRSADYNAYVEGFYFDSSGIDVNKYATEDEVLKEMSLKILYRSITDQMDFVTLDAEIALFIFLLLDMVFVIVRKKLLVTYTVDSPVPDKHIPPQ